MLFQEFRTNIPAKERISNILYGTVNVAYNLSLVRTRDYEARSSATAPTGVGSEGDKYWHMRMLVEESRQREEIKSLTVKNVKNLTCLQERAF